MGCVVVVVVGGIGFVLIVGMVVRGAVCVCGGLSGDLSKSLGFGANENPYCGTKSH